MIRVAKEAFTGGKVEDEGQGTEVLFFTMFLRVYAYGPASRFDF